MTGQTKKRLCLTNRRGMVTTPRVNLLDIKYYAGFAALVLAALLLVMVGPKLYREHMTAQLSADVMVFAYDIERPQPPVGQRDDRNEPVDLSAQEVLAFSEEDIAAGRGARAVGIGRKSASTQTGADLEGSERAWLRMLAKYEKWIAAQHTSELPPWKSSEIRKVYAGASATELELIRVEIELRFTTQPRAEREALARELIDLFESVSLVGNCRINPQE